MCIYIHRWLLLPLSSMIPMVWKVFTATFLPVRLMIIIIITIIITFIMIRSSSSSSSSRSSSSSSRSSSSSSSRSSSIIMIIIVTIVVLPWYYYPLTSIKGRDKRAWASPNCFGRRLCNNFRYKIMKNMYIQVFLYKEI